jgi:hypothetical protein
MTAGGPMQSLIRHSRVAAASLDLTYQTGSEPPDSVLYPIGLRPLEGGRRCRPARSWEP